MRCMSTKLCHPMRVVRQITVCDVNCYFARILYNGAKLKMSGNSIKRVF